MKIICQGCKAKWKVADSLAGQKRKCPKCGSPIEIPRAVSEGSKHPPQLASEAQKEYARSLGINFPETITKREMTKIITEAVERRREEQFAKLDELNDKETHAYQKMREEVLSEIDEEDCRLSTATPAQIVEELASRGLGAILVSFNIDDVDFSDLTDAKFEVSFSDTLTETEMRAVIVSLGYLIARQAKPDARQ